MHMACCLEIFRYTDFSQVLDLLQPRLGHHHWIEADPGNIIV